MIVSSSNINQCILDLPTDCYNDLQPYIDKWERYYLNKLLGCELAGLLYDDLGLANTPQTQRFIDIFNPFCTDDLVGTTCNCNDVYDNCQSIGIPCMLSGFIAYEYTKVLTIKNSLSGGISNKLENSNQTFAIANYKLKEYYNQSIDTFNCIRKYIENSTIYPEYKGVILEKILGI